jgi:hypothetical protein
MTLKSAPSGSRNQTLSTSMATLAMPAAEVYDSGGGTKQKSVAPSTVTLPDTLTKLWQSTASPATFGVSRITMSSGTLTHGPSIHWRLPLITLGRPRRAHQSLPRLSASVVWQSNTEQQLVWAGQRACGRRRLLYQGSSCGLLASCPNAGPLKRAAHGGIENARIATNNRPDIVVIFIDQAVAQALGDEFAVALGQFRAIAADKRP